MIKHWLDFETEKKKASAILRGVLNRLLPGVESMYAGLSYGINPEHAKINDEKLPKLVVDLLQIELLKDRPLRYSLLCKMSEKDPTNPIFDRGGDEDDQFEDDEHTGTLHYSAVDLAERNWTQATYWPRKFVKSFGFPEIFAGIKSPPSLLPVEQIEGPIQLPPLEDFQQSIKDQVVEILSLPNGKKNRGIIRLPTGAGKTRVMVQALVEFWKKKSENTKYLIWIAQTEELCEQAFASFRQLWTTKGIPGEQLTIFRFWGGGRLPNLDEEGVIIAGINKLYQSTGSGEEFQSELKSLAEHVGVLVVDEAHRSITKMYNRIFDALGIRFPSPDLKQTPLIGLTATPYRGYNSEETEYLKNKYNRHFIYPKGKGLEDTKWSNWSSLKNELTIRGILSKPEHDIVKTHVDLVMDKDEESTWNQLKILKPKLLRRLADNYNRNKIIFDKLLSLVERSSVLYFGTSVKNANIMSALLQERGISSAVVTGDTGSGLRQAYIKRFKENEIKVLCNYGVLTTGFDAPKIDAIMIARPTESPNLYEQMIGRGLRGKKFGGTDKCLIVDVADNIYFHKLIPSDKFTDGSESYWNTMNKGD